MVPSTAGQWSEDASCVADDIIDIIDRRSAVIALRSSWWAMEPRIAEACMLRWGIVGDEDGLTLRRVATSINVSSQRAQQMDAKARRWLHDSLTQRLSDDSKSFQRTAESWPRSNAPDPLPVRHLRKEPNAMDSRFASVHPDDDPRYPGMVVATVRELRDLIAFPIGAQHTHDGVAMKVVGRDANIGTVRLRPIPNAPARPSGPVHLALGYSDDERTCPGEGGSLTTNVGEVECAACLDAALAEAERQVAEYTARKAALKGGG